MHRIARMIGLAAVISASTGIAMAQSEDAPAAPASEEADLPTGWEVLDREVEAIGGAERFLKVKNIVATGIFSMAMMGIEGEIVRTEAAPDKVHMNIQLGPMGAMTRAADGKTAWVIQPGSESVTILDGEMAEEMLEGTKFYDRVLPHEKYASAEMLGIEELRGTPCYKLNLTTKKGKDSVVFFEVKTGYRVKTMSRSAPDSEVYDAVTEFSDYRDVGGIMHAFVIKQNAQGNDFVITFETIVHDAEIDNGIFSPPAEI